MKSMVKLLIFDLDGTLLNSLRDLAGSVNYALRLHGFPEHPPLAYRHFVGNGIAVLLERVLPEGAKSAENVALLWKDFMHHYGLHRADLTAPYAGIPELLEALQQQGLLLAVASNKFHSATEAMVRLYFGESTFQFVHGKQEEVPAKPDPAVVQAILAEAGVTPEETLFIGDSDVDMLTAHNSGVPSVGVTWGFRSQEELQKHGANYIVNTPAEILQIVHARR